MAQVSREAMVELLQTVNKTQSMQIDEQTKTIRDLLYYWLLLYCLQFSPLRAGSSDSIPQS